MANTTTTSIFNSRLHQIAPLLANAVISCDAAALCLHRNYVLRSTLLNTAGLL
ncbi:hypothetical protein SISSUDRAFT_1056054 [Sistotremastrum suecicum HHB10207 ss-3]|uniref:Uncharacterized protein n=1 Tax=Sistotremastrum suecicum HHB10207 ss-3 TaxID=1314776 RepID=A0A165XBA9_9AGAM|nr:hypothetical protein SISSUDRAFT_1056054 [Sistotremastrum suecicum HHB10207 ss-3]